MTRSLPAALLAALATALLAAPPALADSGGSGVPPASDYDTLPSTTTPRPRTTQPTRAA